VRAAADDWGVMHIAGHDIPAELMDRLRAIGTAFFALPVQDKEAYANDPATGRLQGYDSRLAANACGGMESEEPMVNPRGAHAFRAPDPDRTVAGNAVESHRRVGETLARQ